MPAPQPPVAFAPDPDLHRVGQAASLALAIMGRAKVATWADLDGVLPSSVTVEDDQFDLLRDHLTVISWLRATVRATKDTPGVKGRTVAVCPVCGHWLLLGSDATSVPKQCPASLACLGTPVKVSAARKASTEPAVSALELADDDRSLDFL